MENEKEMKNEENEAKLYGNSGNRKSENAKKNKGITYLHRKYKSLNTIWMILVRWTTKTIAEELDREELLRVTFREFLIYIIFVIIVTVCKYEMYT